jgi:hypothetical protein
VRWTGVIVPPEAGDYLIGFTGQDGYRVWFDGKLIAEADPPSVDHPDQNVLSGKDHAYPVRIEYLKPFSAERAWYGACRKMTCRCGARRERCRFGSGGDGTFSAHRGEG